MLIAILNSNLVKPATACFLDFIAKRSLISGVGKIHSRIMSTTTSESKPVKGEFVHKGSAFLDVITADGSSGFKAEKERYHLYVSLSCPFAHRTLVMRKLKGLEEVIPITVVDWYKDERGWMFTDKKPKCSLDPIHGAKFLKEIYLRARPDYTDKFSVPVLFDKQKDTIVSNDSGEILRMFNSAFNEFCPTEEQKKLDVCPESLRTQNDELNAWIYPGINIGVYRAGFAGTQEAYDIGVKGVFESLEKVEAILSKTRFLTGDTFTESDVRLFTSLVRFDKVYHCHFKCNKKRLVDYPNTWGFVREVYQMPGVSDTVDFEHIIRSYYEGQRHVNPLGIVPIGPDVDFMEPHGREKLSQK